jgi:sRNA-binding carbon storage regulator CsrA
MKKSELQQIIREEITTALLKPNTQTTNTTSSEIDSKEQININKLIDRLKPAANNLRNIDVPNKVANFLTELFDYIQSLNKKSLNNQEIITALRILLKKYS